MLKRVLLYSLFFIATTYIMAGDVASFMDEGFSADGKLYVFGQYGTTDSSKQGYAEIYTVNIAENDYVDEGLFETPASSKTSGKNGHTVYTDLRSASSRYLNALKLESVGIDNTLYIKSGAKSASDTISITDFESAGSSGAQTYDISLKPWYSGSTASSQSSFFITVEKKDANGALLEKQVIGNPDIKRRGVVGYSIERILKSPDGKSFIFIIEKTLATSSGKSIRYMVETLEVSNFRK